MADETSRLLINSKDFRTCSIAKNGKGYTPGNEYLPATPDTISDGDNRGRDPKTNGGSIGTKIDIDTRNKQMAKNADGYSYGNEYCAGHPDTISDGDCRGRDPKQQGEDAGTCIDFNSRSCSLAKNSNLYTKDHQYGFGNGTV